MAVDFRASGHSQQKLHPKNCAAAAAAGLPLVTAPAAAGLRRMQLDTIFSKSQVPNTELFALDVNLVIQLLSSFDGKQIYPPAETKEATFTQATENREIALIPNGTYKMSRKLKNVGITATAKLEIIDGQIILKAGSTISPQEFPGLTKTWSEKRKTLDVDNGVLQEDVQCVSVSEASSLVAGMTSNGWTSWKNSSGNCIDIYRHKE